LKGLRRRYCLSKIATVRRYTHITSDGRRLSVCVGGFVGWIHFELGGGRDAEARAGGSWLRSGLRVGTVEGREGKFFFQRRQGRVEVIPEYGQTTIDKSYRTYGSILFAKRSYANLIVALYRDILVLTFVASGATARGPAGSFRSSTSSARRGRSYQGFRRERGL
jgi:hypothetical protein